MSLFNKNALKHSVADVLLVSLLLAGVAQSAYAAPPPAPTTLPTGGSVVTGSGSGSATIGAPVITTIGNGKNQTQTASETITQTTSKVIINWSSFNVGSNATVTFVQPSSTSVALNRIGGNSASQIFGALNANGILFLVNTNGIVFGAGSQVNVGGLVATTSDINNSDFENGNYNYNFSPTANNHSSNSINTSAQIINDGTITVNQDNSLVALIGHDVENDGTIQAKVNLPNSYKPSSTDATGNKVQLGAGDTFSIDLNGDGLISLAVSDPKAKQLLAQNSGTITANGGTILMTAAAAENTVNSLVNMDGVLQADNVSTKDGSVQLVANGSNSQVTVAGSVSAKGGSVETSSTGTLNVKSGASVTAASWDIDPGSITVSNGTGSGSSVNASVLAASLGNGTSTTITASNNITVANNVTDTGHTNASLTLDAGNDITFNNNSCGHRHVKPAWRIAQSGRRDHYE